MFFFSFFVRGGGEGLVPSRHQPPYIMFAPENTFQVFAPQNSTPFGFRKAPKKLAACS